MGRGGLKMSRLCMHVRRTRTSKKALSLLSSFFCVGVCAHVCPGWCVCVSRRVRVCVVSTVAEVRGGKECELLTSQASF